jgi:hypothetical protein
MHVAVPVAVNLAERLVFASANSALYVTEICFRYRPHQTDIGLREGNQSASDFLLYERKDIG